MAALKSEGRNTSTNKRASRTEKNENQRSKQKQT